MDEASRRSFGRETPHPVANLMDIYQDQSAPVAHRVEDLLGRMSVEQKAGLLFHPMAVFGDPETDNGLTKSPSVVSMISERGITHFSVLGSSPDGGSFAKWHNQIQRIAAEQPLAIPVTLSSDPRHSFTDNPLAAALAGPFSQWPEPIGLAAIGSSEVVEDFANYARQEYLAVGIRVALHPQIDLATEPRWCRISGTFGEDAELAARLARAYISGFQQGPLGPHSVATMAKHFPGGGPQKDGEDPHFDYGREQIYPGEAFDLHLKPFEAAIVAGGSQIMPYYGMPIGTRYEEVGFAFNRSVICELLRESLGFDGIVCTDWGILTDSELFGEFVPARAWGVEHLGLDDRILKAVDAGIDQFGGEYCVDAVVRLVGSGDITASRLDVSAGRLLREKFRLGLFDSCFVDEDRADEVVGNHEFRQAGLRAQSASVTILANGAHSAARLPLSSHISVYVEGINEAALRAYAEPASDPMHAQVAILRVKAPYEPRQHGFERLFHAGSLEFPESEMARLVAVCRRVPTIIDVTLDRPAVLGPLPEEAGSLVATYGCSDEALLAVLFGASQPMGSLPFDLPSSMAAVVASRTDVPFDTHAPAFRLGHGIRY
jgi:beta-glucosidase